VRVEELTQRLEEINIGKAAEDVLSECISERLKHFTDKGVDVRLPRRGG